jgi:hypothetical protein
VSAVRSNQPPLSTAALLAQIDASHEANALLDHRDRGNGELNTIYAAKSAASFRVRVMSGILGCGASRYKAILAASKWGSLAMVAKGGATSVADFCWVDETKWHDAHQRSASSLPLWASAAIAIAGVAAMMVTRIQITIVFESEGVAASGREDAEAVLTDPASKRHIKGLHKNLADIAYDPLIKDSAKETPKLVSFHRTISDEVAPLAV